MGNCLQKQKSEKQLLRDQLLKDKDDTGMITFYEKESEEREEKEEIPSVYDETFDVEINLDDRYKLWEWLSILVYNESSLCRCLEEVSDDIVGSFYWVLWLYMDQTLSREYG